MTFTRDIMKGEQAEGSVATILSHHWDVHKASDLKKGRFYDWDLSASQPGTGYEVFTVEVKYDEMQSETGNIAIEVYNTKSDKPSGLTATKADLWCHVLKDSMWITSVTTLKEFCEEHKPFKKFKKAGDENATILLYKTNDILKIFDRIDGIPEDEVEEKIRGALDGI